MPSGILQNLEITTTNETIMLDNISAGENIYLSSNGGDIEFGSLFVGKEINLNAKNGNIDGSIVGTWEEFSISCTIKKGQSNLPSDKDGGSKMLVAECNNGNIHIEFVDKVAN